MGPRIRPPLGVRALLVALVAGASAGCAAPAPPTPPAVPTPGRPTPAPVIVTHVPGSATACPRRLHGEWVAGPGQGTAVSPGDLATIQVIVTARLRATGLAATIGINGTDGIVVELPVASDITELRALVATTGRFELIPLPPEGAPGAVNATKGRPLDPKPPTLLDGSAVVSSLAVTNETGTALQLTLSGKAREVFADYTSSHVGQNFALVIDDLVVATPNVEGPNTGGVVVIAGSLTSKEAMRLGTILRFGPLPKPLTESTVTEVPGRCPSAASPTPDQRPLPSPSQAPSPS